MNCEIHLKNFDDSFVRHFNLFKHVAKTKIFFVCFSTATTTTTDDNTTTSTTTASTTTTAANTTTTTEPTTTTTSENTTTTTQSTTTSVPANTTTTTRPSTTTPGPAPRGNTFDGWSFFGGILLTLGLSAIGYVSFRYYKVRTGQAGAGTTYNRF